MTSFLEALDDRERAALRERGTVRRFSKGIALFHERQNPERAVVLLSGRVKLTRVTDEGREVLLALRGPGDLIGEQSALDELPHSATAVALEPVEALVLTTADFLHFVTTTPVAAHHVMQMLSTRLRDADGKRVEFASQDSLGRLAGRLVELCERFGAEEEEGIAIDLALTQEELAGWAGASREAVARALQQLRELGWVETGRRRIVVRDLEALRSRAV